MLSDISGQENLNFSYTDFQLNMLLLTELEVAWITMIPTNCISESDDTRSYC